MYSPFCPAVPDPIKRTPRLIRQALLGLGSLLGLALPWAASAQTQAQAPAELQEIVITGSRIPVPANINSTSPITAVSNQDIQLAGQVDTGEILNSLPQNIIAFGADLGAHQNPLTSAGGISTADLRGLGPQRTLVMVDGKRLYIGDPNQQNPNPAADLNEVPAAIIERVDVVTGGASAVYGSDAVAGVINFIMKQNFQGIEIGGQYGFYDHNNREHAIQALDASVQTTVGPTNPTFTAPNGNIRDGDKRDLSIVLGTNLADGTGNVTAYATWHKQDPVRNGDRDFANCQLVSSGNNDRFDYSCIGTTNSNYFQPEVLQPNGSLKAGSVYNVVGTSFLPNHQVGANPPWEFNPNPYEFMQEQSTRWNAGVYGHVDVTDYFKPYLTATVMDDRSDETVGPSAAFKASYPFTPDNFYRVNCTNPLLSAQEQGILCTPAMIAADTPSPGNNPAGLAIINIGRRDVEGGGRDAYYDHTNYRMAVGAKGDIAKGITYDAYTQYFYTSFYTSNTNYLNYANIGQALIAKSSAAGPVCTNIIGNCVPWNIFATGGVTPAQLGYLLSPGNGYGTDSETIVHADVTFELGQYGLIFPAARDGVGLNVGAEHRADTYHFNPDAVEGSGELAGFSGAAVPINAGETVDEGFFEVRTPLVQDHDWAKDLSLDLGYRYSNYSLAGGASTYKFEVQYAPTSDFRLRYSFDRAIRAPNLFELFNPGSYGQTSVIGTDPCSGAKPTASLAACMRTGVTAAQYGSIPDCTAAQCGQVIEGNTALKPEKANTYSVGVTLTPAGLPDLTGSLDYWHIQQSGLIGPVPANILFSNCINNNTPFDCSQLVRNPVTGALTGATVAGGGYVLQKSINTGAGLTSGIDLQTAYVIPLSGLGTLTWGINGTWLQHSITTPYVGSGSYDCAGLFGASCNTNSVNPKWRHNMRLTWETPWSKLLVSAHWRYIAGVDFDNNSSNSLLQYAEEGSYDAPNSHIGSYSYFDLSAVWPVVPAVQLRAGINNLFDKDPPVLGSEITGTGSANTYSTYDTLGRAIFVAFTAKF
jgi:outer membrane receptor protein involved in Fe transport